MPTLEELASAATAQNITSSGDSAPAPMTPSPASLAPQFNTGPDDTVPSYSSPAPAAPATPNTIAAAQDGAPSSGDASSAAAWTEHLRRAGMDVSGFKSPDDLAEAFVRQQNELKSIKPYAEYGQQFMPYAQKIQQLLQGQPAAPQQPPVPAEAPKSREERLREHWNKIWQRPTFDPAWEQMVTRDENGMYVGVNAGIPAHVVQGMNEYRAWQSKALNNLLQDPFELQWKALEPGIQDVVQEMVQRELNAYRINTDFEELDRQYAPVLYQHDENGKRVVDPITGEYRWTPLGQFCIQKMQELRNMGINDPYANFTMAMDSAKAWLYDQQSQTVAASPAPPTQAPAPAPAQPAAPSMYAGAASAPLAAPAPQQSFLDRARNIAIHSGNMGGAASPGGQPDVQSFDNENFFSRAASQHGMLPSAA